MGRSFTASILYLLLLLLSSPRPSGAVSVGENHGGARWRFLATERFRVIFPARHEEIARRVLASAEEALPGLAGPIGGAPGGRIDIRVTAWDDLSGGRAYQAWPRIELEIYPLDREPERMGFLRQVTIHELTHICHYEAVGGGPLRTVLAPAAMTNLPDWWVEGLPSAAEKPAAEAREQDLVRVIARTGEIPRLRRLDDVDQGDHLDNILIYRIGESKTRWFFRRFGNETAASVNRGMRPPRWSFDDALRRATGMGEREIHEAWLADLRAAAGEEIPAAETIPLPSSIERPVGFAFSPKGDLAVAAVRDEDVYRTELYLRRAGEERFRLIDAEPVGGGLSWSPDGRYLAYARRVPGPLNEPRRDLFLHDVREGQTRRLTRGARATEPVWTGAARIAALSFDDSSGAVRLLRIDAANGEVEGWNLPEEIGAADRIAAGPEGTIVLTACPPDGMRRLWIFDPRRESEHAFRLAGPEGAVPYEPFLTGGGEGKVLFLDYREGSPRIVPLGDPEEGKVGSVGGVPLRIRRPGTDPDGRIWAVVSRGRYGSAVERMGGAEVPAAAGTVPPWHGEVLLEAGNPPRAGESYGPSRPFHRTRAIRPRPEPSVESIGSEAVFLRVKDLLADPTDTHRLHLDGRIRWDSALREGTLLYENRSHRPTILAQGTLGEKRGATWRETVRGGSLGLSLPFRFDSWSTRYTLDASLAHFTGDRTEEGTATANRVTLLRSGLSRRSSFARSASVLAIRWETGIDTGRSRSERGEAEASWTRAFFRNDWYIGLDGSIGVESGARKRVSVLYPYGIENPVRAVSGTRTASWGASLSYPWSEDLEIGLGPLTLERLTHRLLYREGLAWNEGDNGADRVRAAAMELRLRLFSGLFLPFAGTNTVTLAAGAAREIEEGAATAWYFSIDADFWTERWTAKP